jgi:CheY-like chemotaxis protein
MNLVTNANKFTEKHGTIEINFVHKEDLLLEISVRDDGIGISSENIKRIFSAFEQIENSHSKNGTGLGLAICTKLCNLMNATMNVDSELGKGSVFTITVPYEVSENINKLDCKDCKLLEGKTVLVVDDNSNNRLFLSETLFEWNMQPIICASPLEALRMILGNRYNFDLGLIDICMPNISGNELAEQIKSERPLFPMIALSSNDSFISNNFKQKINKPINKLQLFNAVYTVLNTKCNPQTYLGCCNNLQEESSIITCDKFNKKLNILIAEDVPYNKTLLVTMLENMKYTSINTAENGQIAVEMIRESHEKGTPYHILLLDLRMPVMDGYQVLDIYHKNHWKLPNIIVVTASIMDKDREKCKMLGAKYFINKPIDIKELETTMLHACELTENLLYI